MDDSEDHKKDTNIDASAIDEVAEGDDRKFVVMETKLWDAAFGGKYLPAGDGASDSLRDLVVGPQQTTSEIPTHTWVESSPGASDKRGISVAGPMCEPHNSVETSNPVTPERTAMATSEMDIPTRKYGHSLKRRRDFVLDSSHGDLPSWKVVRRLTTKTTPGADGIERLEFQESGSSPDSVRLGQGSPPSEISETSDMVTGLALAQINAGIAACMRIQAEHDSTVVVVDLL